MKNASIINDIFCQVTDHADADVLMVYYLAVSIFASTVCIDCDRANGRKESFSPSPAIDRITFSGRYISI